MKTYASYRDVDGEWIRCVPSHWQVKAAKYVCSFNDDVIAETTDPNALIEYVEISDVDEVHGLKGSQIMSFKEAPSRARRRVQHGDVILSTVRTYLRAVASIEAPAENLVVSTGFAVLRPQELDSGFARYAFVADGFIGSVIARSTGVSYPAINASDLVRIAVPVPPRDEQCAIATYLDIETARIDALIEQKKLLVETLLEMKKSVVSEAVTLGIDRTSDFVPSGLSWAKTIPVGWKTASLKRCVRLTGGHTPSTTNPAYWDGSVPWFSPKDMKSDELADSIDHVTELAVSESGLNVIELQTTMIVVRGMILAHTFPVCVSQVRGTLNQDMKALV